MRAPVAGLSAQLRKRGLNNVTIDGVRPMHAGDEARRHARSTLRFVPNREDLFEPPRRRLQRPEARVRHRRRGRGHRHRGARRDRVRHARRHPRPARPRARRRRHRHRRRRPRLRRRRRRRHPRLLAGRAPRGARPPARAVGRRRDHRAAAGRPSQPGDVIVGDADGVIVIPPAPRRGGRRRRARPGGGGRLDRRAGRGRPPRRRPLPDERASGEARYEAWRETTMSDDRADPEQVAARLPTGSRSGSSGQELHARATGSCSARSPASSDMSVVPVREAIRQLEAEGLVTFERNVGAHVSMVDDSAVPATACRRSASSRAPPRRSPPGT